MPLSTGNERIATALLRNFGRAVTLSDGSTIQGKFRTQVENEELGDSPNKRYYSYHLQVPVVNKGTINKGQNVTIGETIYHIVDMYEDDDGWIKMVLSRVRSA